MINKKWLENNKAFLAIVLAAFLGGSTVVVTKIALKEIPPLSFTFLRFLAAAVFIMPFFLRSKLQVKKDIYKLILISLLATVNVTLFAFGVRLTTATIGSTLYATVPIIAAILSYFILKEKINRKKYLGILIGFAGTLIIILLPTIGKINFLQSGLIGNFIIFIAVISFSLYSVVSKNLQKKFSPIYLTTFFVSTTVVAQLFLGSTEFISNPNWVYKVSTGAILATLYVGVVGTFIYYLLYQYAIKHGTPVIASMTLYLQPAATFIWASFLIGESLTPGFLVGAVLVFIGAWITSRK